METEARGLDDFISDVYALLAEPEALLGSIDTAPLLLAPDTQSVALALDPSVKYRQHESERRMEANVLMLRRLLEILVEGSQQQRPMIPSSPGLRNEQNHCLEWVDSVEFARLQAELTAAYARTNDTICESGVCSMLEEGVEYSHTRKMRRKDGQQSYCSELVSIQLLPFDAHKASSAMWHVTEMQLFRYCVHATHQPADMSSSGSGYQGLRQQSDLLAVKFQRKVLVDGADVAFNVRQVTQRYETESRNVHICSQITTE
ncbi:hypothetical protein FI667_g16171, partial [Globisporangium splendens]